MQSSSINRIPISSRYSDGSADNFQLNRAERNEMASAQPHMSPGFYAGLGLLSAILMGAVIHRCYESRRQRGRLARQADIIARRRSEERTNIRQPGPAYLLPSTETLSLYDGYADFRKMLLQAWLDLETQPGARPPSYRSRLTLDLEAVMSEREMDHGTQQESGSTNHI